MVALYYGSIVTLYQSEVLLGIGKLEWPGSLIYIDLT